MTALSKRCSRHNVHLRAKELLSVKFKTLQRRSDLPNLKENDGFSYQNGLQDFASLLATGNLPSGRDEHLCLRHAGKGRIIGAAAISFSKPTRGRLDMSQKKRVRQVFEVSELCVL
jgi:hypothetical protein